MCDINDSEIHLFLSRYKVSTLAETLRLCIITDHSVNLPPSCVEATHEWRHTFGPSLYLHDVVKDVFALRVME